MGNAGESSTSSRAAFSRRAAAFLLLVLSAPVRVPAGEPLDVSHLLAPIREKHGVPGMIGAIVRGDRIVAIGADGVRMRGSQRRMQADDPFHLGSCTKSMTATLAAILVEEGKIRWDTTIGEALGDYRRPIHPGWSRVTLEQLLVNRAGAPTRLRGNLERRLWEIRKDRTGSQRAVLIEGVLEQAPEHPPGTTFRYSNAGFVIAGAMLEKVTGESWEDLMQYRLFDPLGMTTAGFGAPGTGGTSDQPRGHRPDGSPVEPGFDADLPPSYGPSAIVRCDMEDWTKYIALHLSGARGAGRLLEPQSFRKLHLPAGPIPGDRGNDYHGYAMGWFVQKWGPGRLFMHGGTNGFWTCYAYIAPEQDFAVLVVCNQGGDRGNSACNEAVRALFRQARGR